MHQLRDYQLAGRDELAGLFADGHRRATLVLPCGTGKTVVASHLISTAGRARTVVFVPTLALLHQTWVALQRDYPAAAMLGVCSPSTPGRRAVDDPEGLTAARTAALLHAQLSTDPDTVAEQLTSAPGALLIVATYASSPVLAQAAASSHTTFDLVVCDEARRTAGAADKAWATPVHAVPAHRRLFMTATPRTITVTDTTDPDLDDVEIVSMSSLADYGPHVAPIRFRDAITAGYLSDSEIAVIGVGARSAWNRLVTSATETGHRASHAGSHLALLNAADTHDLRSVLVFHNRIHDSRRWTEQLQKTAEAIGVAVFAAHIDGATADDERATVLAHLTHPGDHLAVVSNCRVFAEGIDVPALDAVMFAAPRTAGPDIVQIVGRAIRPHPHRRHRKALIILPVLDYPDDNADLDTKAARTSYLAAWQVLTSLAEEDELLHDSLARWRDHIENGAPPPEPGTTPLRVDTTALSDAATSFVLKTIARASSPHLITATRLRAFHARYGHTRPAPGTLTDDGFPLADRLRAARAAYRTGRMHPRVVAQFDTIPGFSWSVRTSGKKRTPHEWITLVQHYIDTTGVHTITRDAWVTDPATGARADIGRWVHQDARRPRYLTGSERDQLTATGLRLP